jgi:predicted ATPase
LGKTPELFWVLLGLFGFYLERAEIKTAREVAEQCLSLAQDVHDPIFLVLAHRALGDVLYRLGEFALAREHLEEGVALYDSQQRHSSSLVEDPRVGCLSFAAVALWYLGYPDQAQQRSHEALTLAQEISRPLSLAFALNLDAIVHKHRREVQAAQERSEAAIALSTAQEFPFFLALGTIGRGWALTEQGQVEEGITQIRQGLAAWQAMRTELTRPHFLVLLAEVYGKAGQGEEGLSVLAEALALIDKTGERYFEAELYRLKGTLTLQSKTSHRQVKASQNKSRQVRSPKSGVTNPQAEAEAEACFLQAIEIARNQQAKSLELRAATSLSRLWQQQGKKAEAHKMLAEIYGWFTEGFDTADLQEAKTLLEELSE